MTSNLSSIVESHGKWVRSEPDGVRANLRGAILRSAGLHSADLRDADLRCADLSGANLAGTGVISATIGEYTLWCTPTDLRIGCQRHSHDKWRRLSDRQIIGMDGTDALDWWTANKDMVFAIMDSCAKIVSAT